jgi:hypothetical protein
VATIKYVDKGNDRIYLKEDWRYPDNLPFAVGDRVSVSPVYFRWVGHNVMPMNEDGFQFRQQDFHIVKQIDETIASFVDVSGPPLNESSGTDDAFRGLVYSGTSETAADTDFPTDENDARVKSVKDGSSQNPATFGEDTTLGSKTGVQGVALSPGMEVFCSDLDYRLLGVLVRGRIQASVTTEIHDASAPS